MNGKKRNNKWTKPDQAGGSACNYSELDSWWTCSNKGFHFPLRLTNPNRMGHRAQHMIGMWWYMCIYMIYVCVHTQNSRAVVCVGVRVCVSFGLIDFIQISFVCCPYVKRLRWKEKKHIPMWFDFLNISPLKKGGEVTVFVQFCLFRNCSSVFFTALFFWLSHMTIKSDTLPSDYT